MDLKLIGRIFRYKEMRDTILILEDFTTTYHNFGRWRGKTTKWKSDKIIDKLIYKKLKKSENKA